MDEGRKRRWDVTLGIVGPMVTVIGLSLGVLQFNAGERNKVKLENQLLIQKDTIEFQRKLWLEKLDAYKAVVVLAGKIAAVADQHPLTRAVSDQQPPAKPPIDDLWRELTAAYWGQRLFMEDDGVIKALRDFYDTVRDFRAGWAHADKVKVKADALAEACRASIRRTAPQGTPT